MRYIFTTTLYLSALCSFILFLIHCIINSNLLFIKKYHRFLLLCFIMIGLRLFLPLDIPTVHIIDIKKILPDIFMFLYRPFFHYSGISVNIFNVFSLIWIVGTIFFLSRLFYSYYAMRKMVHNLTPCKSKNITQILDQILSQYKKTVSFQLVTTEQMMSPAVFGIRKPYIIIPDLPLNDREWKDVLAHEAAHYYHGDMILRFIFEIFHAAYWWNPLYYIIKKYMAFFLELNIDSGITKRYSEAEQLSYLECLLKISKLIAAENQPHFIAAFQGDHTSFISKRFHIIAASDEKKKWSYHLVNRFILFILVLCVFIFPTFFTITPSHIPDHIREEGFLITEDNAYFLKLDDDSYDLYVDGKFIINLDSTSGIKDKIPIYSNPKEVLPDD